MIPQKHPKFVQVVSVKQNGVFEIYKYEKSTGNYTTLLGTISANDRRQAVEKASRKWGISLMQLIAKEKNPPNPSSMSRAVVALRNKIRRGYTAGMPEDQSTHAERQIVRGFPQYFENDRGYIKVKVTGKRRMRRNSTSSSTEVRSPTSTETSTKAYTADNVTVTGGAGAGATTEVTIINKRNPKLSERDKRTLELFEDDIKDTERKLQGTKDAKERAYLKDAIKNLKLYLAQWKRRHITKRNATAADFKQHQKVRLQDLVRKFQGVANGLKHRILEADTAPKNKYLLGYLAQMKIRANGKIVPINFDGGAYLAADIRNNLHAVGKDAIISNVKKPNPGDLKKLGELIQVDYVTAKAHIENGQTVRFYHKLGEVDKQHPTLYIDHDGFPIINGGNYEIWDVGIVN